MDEIERHLVEVLVTKARAGDPEAFTSLYEHFSTDLTRFVRSLVGNSHDAQDVAQDAWLEAWRCLGNYRDGAAFRPWLFGIAKHLASRLRQNEVSFISLNESHEPHTTNLVLDKILFREYLDTLGPELRAVIELRFIEGLSCHEIAVVTGRRLGTVHSRLHHAKCYLRRWIKENHPESTRNSVEGR